MKHKKRQQGFIWRPALRGKKEAETNPETPSGSTELTVEVLRAGGGFIAFTSLLVISVVTLAIAVSISLLGISEANVSLGFKKGQETLKVAEGCAEEALLRLRDNANYTDSSLNVGSGSCNISISGTGSDRTIDITATISGPPDYVKKIQITAKRAGNSINLVSWQEIE